MSEVDDSTSTRAVYREAGVDIDAANAALKRIRVHAESTFAATGAAAPIGHFGGIYRLDGDGDRLLVASADGIGTKIRIAIASGGDAHNRVAADLVNHCVNDILACGAMPMFFLDYIAMGRLDPLVLERLVAGMANACRENGVALIGGETAEMPGIYSEGDYDVAGFIVGQVDADKLVDGSLVQEGDALIGLVAKGLHTNGYSLARSILDLNGDAESAVETLALELPGGDGASIGDALLQPHPSYLSEIRPLLARNIVNGMAHVTGGGLVENVPRMLDESLVAVLTPHHWPRDPLQAFLVARGALDEVERYRAFNGGIGFVVAVDSQHMEEVLSTTPGAVEIGSVRLRLGDEAQVQGLK